LGVLAVEMEAAAIFTVSAMSGARAGCLLTVSNTIGFGEDAWIGESGLKDAVDNMMELALETLNALN
jgi:purine-nucleoside phosphorylase